MRISIEPISDLELAHDENKRAFKEMNALWPSLRNSPAAELRFTQLLTKHIRAAMSEFYEPIEKAPEEKVARKRARKGAKSPKGASNGDGNHLVT